jgi:hypothetical protein
MRESCRGLDEASWLKTEMDLHELGTQGKKNEEGATLRGAKSGRMDIYTSGGDV